MSRPASTKLATMLPMNSAAIYGASAILSGRSTQCVTAITASAAIPSPRAWASAALASEVTGSPASWNSGARLLRTGDSSTTVTLVEGEADRIEAGRVALVGTTAGLPGG